ncbi:MAG: hypothetical protein M0R80_20425 [Proteobacteria bacterium]|nr:hypothetical protein [Pseudomonadota bacterium]
MKTSPGMKLALFFLFLLGAGAALLSVRLTFAVQDLEARLDAAKESVDGLADALNAKNELDAAARAADADGAESKRDLEPVMLKLRALSRRLDALEAGDIEDLGIESLIDRKLLEKMPPGGAPGQRSVKLDDVSEKLGLTDAQKKRAAEVIDGAKQEVLDVLRAEDDDGLSMADRIAGHVKGPGTRAEKTRRILTDLFDRSVPGSDESYFTAMANARQGAITDFKSGLSDDQLSAFGGLGIDVFGIETGYSPFAAEMKSALTGHQ